MNIKENHLAPRIKNYTKYFIAFIVSLILLFATLPIVTIIISGISAGGGITTTFPMATLAVFVILIATSPLALISFDIGKKINPSSRTNEYKKKPLQLIGVHLLTVIVFLVIGISAYMFTIATLGL